MKLSLTFLTIAALFQSAIAFAPIASINRIATAPTTSSSSSSSTAVFADGDDDDDDEAGLDLNLEEMFDMYVFVSRICLLDRYRYIYICVCVCACLSMCVFVCVKKLCLYS
jgi:hypothetical protein